MYTSQSMGEIRPIHTLNYLTASRSTTLPSVREAEDSYTAAGALVPAPERHARRVAQEAEAWLAFATERTRMRPDTLTRKALSSLAFSVACRASSFCVPTKLSGVREHQRRLWTMVRDSVDAYSELALDASGDGLVALYDGDAIGEVQPKHLGWLRPLVPFGARLYLGRVTGSERDGYTLGVNVVVGHVGESLGRLLNALGDPGLDHYGRRHARDGSTNPAGRGDGQPGSSTPTLAVPRTGYGEEDPRTVPLRLVVRPEHEALSGDADDVVLFREIDGTARASVPHVVRHSPSGIEWGYGGSGPADLARSVLVALADETTADGLYQRFKAEVVARIPYAGGVLRAGDIRTWIDRQPEKL